MTASPLSGMSDEQPMSASEGSITLGPPIPPLAPEAGTPTPDARTFPIQGPTPHRRIPWWLAEEAYAVYSGRYGTSQSLERLAERGGFSAGEMDMFAPGWREKLDTVAQLRAALRSYELMCRAIHTLCDQHGIPKPPENEPGVPWRVLWLLRERSAALLPCSSPPQG